MKYDLYLPDRYKDYGVEFAFRDVTDPQWFEAAEAYLCEIPGRALFVPEKASHRIGGYLQLKDRLARNGLLIERVRVPGTSYRAWLYRFDLHDANDQLIGWICRPNDDASQPE
jgi:hypothetical protein